MNKSLDNSNSFYYKENKFTCLMRTSDMYLPQNFENLITTAFFQRVGMVVKVNQYCMHNDWHNYHCSIDLATHNEYDSYVVWHEIGAIALTYPPPPAPPPNVIDDLSWKNAAESFTVALTLTLGEYESAIAPMKYPQN